MSINAILACLTLWLALLAMGPIASPNSPNGEFNPPPASHPPPLPTHPPLHPSTHPLYRAISDITVVLRKVAENPPV